MAIIETKYSVGDVVWYATTTIETKQHPCPDCLGSLEWKATSPAGAEFAVACPRCSQSHMSNRDLSLKYSQNEPRVERLTIGLVRPFSGFDNQQHQYMAHETGIGSGTLYYEDRLFPTEEEAQAHATVLAVVANKDAAGWVAKQYAGSLRFCDYELKDAAIKAAESAAWKANYRANDLISDLNEATTFAEVRAILDGLARQDAA